MLLLDDPTATAARLEEAIAADLDRLLDLMADHAGHTAEAERLRARIVALHHRFEQLTGSRRGLAIPAASR